MRLSPLSAAATLLAGALFAAPSWAGHPGHRDETFCKENPQTCATAEERRAAKDKYCKDNPQKCEALKQEREARHEKRRAQRDAMREKCEASPEECEKLKKARRERRHERSEERAPD